MSRPRAQKHKGRKRPKHWHRGRAEAKTWRRIELPEVGSGADPTAGTPARLRRNGTNGIARGDAL